MAFEPFVVYLSQASNEGPEDLLGDVLRDVAGIMAENIGSNRVFIPCLTITAKLFRSDLLANGGDDTKR